MPRFIDYHAVAPQMPPEAAQQMTAAIKAGKPNELGITPLNLFVSTDGKAWCLCDAPNAEAVMKMHQAMGVPLDHHDVHEVKSLA